MGCDYYEKEYLEITFKNQQKSKTVTIAKSPSWLFPYDEDNETYDQALERQMLETEKLHGNKVIYTNNQWSIANQEKIDEYKEILSYKKIDLDDIQTLTKKIICDPR